ncbi:hypothetical protein [Microbispora sp. H10670]|uniref:hypothetical protein n=1 Tax=Microbispora sp. H10670 TaxID=2729108 RepID=UPI0015FFFDF6|nr:hypothetical protein [Microbispora sp. H10670]
MAKTAPATLPPRAGDTAPLRERDERPGRLGRWLPAVTATAFAGGAAVLHGVSVRDLLVFAAYLAACVALPGTLLVRALYRGRRSLAEEIALGVALGYVAEVVVYAAARAAGAPLLVLAWPAATYAAVAASARLRRRVSRAPRTRAPLWWSWALSLAVMVLVAWSAVTFYRQAALTWPLMAAANVDLPYHLALIGELKHHMPPTVPVVAGEPLLYHWFVYAHLAAASWVTGIEPVVLLFRLGMLPVLAALVVLLTMIARRVAGSRAGALAAVAGTFFVAAPSLYLGASTGVFTWRVLSWTSPSQTFGALLFAPVVLLVIELLERRGDAGRWVLLGAFLVGVMGAKATQLPLLAAGLTAVGAVEAARRRRLPRALLGAAAMTGACLLYAQFVLFGGARNGMVVDPLSLMRFTWGELTGRPGSGAAPLGGALLYALCWTVVWFGAAGLVGRSRAPMGPGPLLLTGMGAAGLGAVVVFGHCQMSQIYFLAGVIPYLAIVAVRGLSEVRARARLSKTAVTLAVGTGVLVEVLLRVVSGVVVPLEPGLPEVLLFRPYAALAVAVASAALVLLVRGWARARVWAFVVFMVSAVGLPGAWIARAVPYGGGGGAAAHRSGAPAEAVPAGTVAAARWLRAHSDPGDLVATNAHCRWGYRNPCDNRHLWLAALAERRVLVEGWTYTSSNMARWHPGLPVQNIPFWDRERLRDNDAAFLAPSPAASRRLRDRYGVRWLVFERLGGIPGGAPAYRAGDYTIYRAG